jgi:hypothetical protein
MILLVLSCLTANATDVSPYEPTFENPRDHNILGCCKPDTVIRVNDIVCVKHDDRAPIEVLSFQSPETSSSAASKGSVSDYPMKSTYMSSLLQGSLSSFQPPPRPLRAEKYWVGIVRRAANISATERCLEIHHLDGWLRSSEDPVAEMMIEPSHITEDASAPGGKLRANIPDCPGWFSNNGLYDKKAMKGGYFFEEAPQGVDDHYVRVVTVKVPRDTKEPEEASAGDDFTAELSDKAEVTKIVIDEAQVPMHSYAMDHIDVLNSKIRSYWAAVADHTRNRELGNSITASEASGMSGFQGGFKTEVLRNITSYIDHMGHVVHWNDGVANWLKIREAGTGMGLPQELEAYSSYLERADVKYTAFDRAAYARTHKPQSVHAFDSMTRKAEPIDKRPKSQASIMVENARKRMAEKAKDAAGESKPKVTMAEIKARKELLLKNIQMDSEVTAQANNAKIKFAEGKEEFDLIRKANYILVTGNGPKPWNVTVDSLPAEDDEFWSGVEGRTKADALKKVKTALKQSQEINLLLLTQAYAKLPPKTPVHYIAAVKASHSEIRRVSDPLADPLLEERSLVRELLDQTPSCGEKNQTPLLLFTANGRERSISGWKNILAFASQPLAMFGGHDSAKASISIIRH